MAQFNYYDDPEFSKDEVCYNCPRWVPTEGGRKCTLDSPEFFMKVRQAVHNESTSVLKLH